MLHILAVNTIDLFVAFFFDYKRGGGLFVLNIYFVDKERGDFEGWKRVAALA